MVNAGLAPALTLMGKARETEKLKALLYYAFVVILFYAPVVFAGKTLIPTLYQPGGTLPPRVAAGSFNDLRTPVNTFNVDLATPAFYEFPVNKLIGDQIKRGEVPLWNPFQGAGTPLAAQYSTRAFFPFQIIENLSPAWSWDYFMLLRPLLAAFVTFCFLRRILLSFPSAFLGGLLYAFSGSFVWFVNLEQMANVAMTLPLLLYSLELLAAKPEEKNIPLASLSFGLILLAGQPETALYALLLGFCYFILRLLIGSEEKSFIKGVGCIIAAFVMGLMLAAPLVLPFLELWSNAHHIHPAGGKMGVQTLVDWKRILPVLLPTGTGMMQDPDAVNGLCPLIKAGGGFYRYLPVNGVWDSLGGYFSVTGFVLALSGAVSVFRSVKSTWRGPALFFFAFAVFILLKNVGLVPFVWLGHLPLFDQVWSLRWAGPVWTFALAAVAAIGLECLLPVKKYERESTVYNGEVAPGPLTQRLNAALERAPHRPFVWAVLIVFFFYAVFALLPSAVVFIKAADLFNARAIPFAMPAIGGAMGVFVVTLFTGLVIVVSKGKMGKGQAGLIALVALELWWAVPRGYSPDWLLYKWAFFGAGLFVVILIIGEMWSTAFLVLFAFIAVFLYMDSSSPKGLPERGEPFPKTPYVDFLKSREGNFRAIGTYGAMMPNMASAYGVKDLHYVNSLAITEFQHFRTAFLHADRIEEEPVSSLWFTGMSERCSVVAPGRSTLGRYRLWYRGAEQDFLAGINGYSFLGVKYIVTPTSVGLPSNFPLVFDKEVRVFENPFVLKRAYFAANVERAASWKDAQRAVAGGGVEPGRTVIIEENVPEGLKRGKGAALIKGSVTIKEYGANRVVLDVDANGAGMVVLSDAWYPGWKARVDGEEREILRAYGLVRAVFVGAGESEVVFTYRPGSFSAGISLFIAAAIINGLLFFRGSRR